MRRKNYAKRIIACLLGVSMLFGSSGTIMAAPLQEEICSATETGSGGSVDTEQNGLSDDMDPAEEIREKAAAAEDLQDSAAGSGEDSSVEKQTGAGTQADTEMQAGAEVQVDTEGQTDAEDPAAEDITVDGEAGDLSALTEAEGEESEAVSGTKEDSDTEKHSREERLAAAAERSCSPEELGYMPGVLLVGFSTAEGTASAEEAAASLDGSVSEVLMETEDVTIVLVSISDETTVAGAAEEYLQLDGVLYAEPDYVAAACGSDSSAAALTELQKQMIQAEEAWDLLDTYDETMGAGNEVTVGVIDSGFDPSASWLSDASVYNALKETGEEKDPYVLVYADLQDGYTPSGAHGAVVASVLAESAGLLQEGGSERVSLIAVDAADPTDTEQKITASTLVRGLQYLKEQGADVINISEGYEEDSTLIHLAISCVCDAGITVVCAAGNDLGTTAVYPSDYAETISVINLQEDGSRAENSCYGWQKDLAAPGGEGTSLAAPMVTAAAALLSYVDGSLSPAKILQILTDTARHADSEENYKDEETGSGCLQMAAALRLAADGESSLAGDGEKGRIALIDTVLEAIPDQVYSGKEIRPEISLSYKGHRLLEDRDYTVSFTNNIQAAEEKEAAVTITGCGSYSGTLTASFRIRKKDLADCQAEEISFQLYTGAALTPDAVVWNGGQCLEEGRDYSVSYRNNTEVCDRAAADGPALLLTGCGNYEGALEIPFSISLPEQLVAEGLAGDISWSLYGDGTLVLEGQGKIPDFGDAKGTAYTTEWLADDLRSSITRVFLQEGITGIGQAAFHDCTSMQEITLPDGLEIIGDSAFLNCTGLQMLDLPETLTRIYSRAFMDCDSLTSIKIPDSVVSAPDGNDERWFQGCDSLETASLSASMTNIPVYCFRECLQLRTADFPETITEIRKGAFHHCEALEGEIQVPEGQKKIYQYTFGSCRKLSGILLPDSVKILEDSCMSYCDSLQELQLPSGIESIGKFALAYCSGLTEVSMADPEESAETVSCSVGFGAFQYCKSLRRVVLPDGLQEISDQMFSHCSSLEEVKLPACLQTIGEEAFWYCENLREVTFPQTLRTIEYRAFGYCSQLREICLPETMAANGLGKNSFAYCYSVKELILPSRGLTSVGDGCFLKCLSLQQVVLPDTVTSIGDDAFSGCSSLQTAILPDQLTDIGEGAFLNCTDLEDVQLPACLQTVGKQAFKACSSLSSVRFGDNLREIKEEAFRGCAITEAVVPFGTIYVPSTEETASFEPEVKILMEGEGLTGQCGPDAFWCYKEDGTLLICGSGAVTEASWLEKLSGAEAVNVLQIGEGVQEIGTSIFENHRSLAELALPESMERIGEQAFSGCSSLTGLTLPKGLTELGRGAFADCSGLTEVTILSTALQEIPQEAFQNCTALQKAVLKSSNITLLGVSAFRNCQALTEVSLPASVEKISASAFRDCTSLQEISLPMQLQEIGAYAFSGCTALGNVNNPTIVVTVGTMGHTEERTSVKTVGAYAFSGCESLQEIRLFAAERVGKAAFAGCTSLETAVLSEDLQALPEEIFKGCVSLSEVTGISGTCTSVGDSAFLHCSSYVPKTELLKNVTTIGSYAFYGCCHGAELQIPASVRTIGSYAFACLRDSEEDADSFWSLSLQSGETALADHAFYQNAALSAVTLPEDLTEIPEGCFASCPEITELQFPEKAERVEAYAFYGDALLPEIHFPESLEEVGAYAFYSASALSGMGEILSEAGVLVGENAFLQAKDVDMTSALDLGLASEEGQNVLGPYRLKIGQSLTLTLDPELQLIAENDAVVKIYTGEASEDAVIWQLQGLAPGTGRIFFVNTEDPGLPAASLELQVCLPGESGLDPYYKETTEESGSQAMELLREKHLVHSWSSTYTVDTAPTASAAGSKSIHCLICDAICPGSAVTIPAKGREKTEEETEEEPEEESQEKDPEKADAEPREEGDTSAEKVKIPASDTAQAEETSKKGETSNGTTGAETAGQTDDDQDGTGSAGSGTSASASAGGGTSSSASSGTAGSSRTSAGRTGETGSAAQRSGQEETRSGRTYGRTAEAGDGTVFADTEIASAAETAAGAEVNMEALDRVQAVDTGLAAVHPWLPAAALAVPGGILLLLLWRRKKKEQSS